MASVHRCRAVGLAAGRVLTAGWWKRGAHRPRSSEVSARPGLPARSSSVPSQRRATQSPEPWESRTLLPTSGSNGLLPRGYSRSRHVPCDTSQGNGPIRLAVRQVQRHARLANAQLRQCFADQSLPRLRLSVCHVSPALWSSGPGSWWRVKHERLPKNLGVTQRQRATAREAIVETRTGYAVS